MIKWLIEIHWCFVSIAFKCDGIFLQGEIPHCKPHTIYTYEPVLDLKSLLLVGLNNVACN
jgi:hypothetical protein